MSCTAWEFIEKEKPHFDLVTLCPPATLGPLRHTIHSIKDLNESNGRIWRMSCQSSKDAPVPYMPVHTYIDVRVSGNPSKFFLSGWGQS